MNLPGDTATEARLRRLMLAEAEQVGFWRATAERAQRELAEAKAEVERLRALILDEVSALESMASVARKTNDCEALCEAVETSTFNLGEGRWAR